ncbi:hypothetical protein THII_2253 [Thioploca ingrica]|uniref:Uncharacterized protein n=1 Tax=Thioploca ingrica TaxID=40754 RepID=A0A090AMN0_9GAMM|nr:hypothetical protein THII_2253 [Thioploca ingrica]
MNDELGYPPLNRDDFLDPELRKAKALVEWLVQVLNNHLYPYSHTIKMVDSEECLVIKNKDIFNFWRLQEPFPISSIQAMKKMLEAGGISPQRPVVHSYINKSVRYMNCTAYKTGSFPRKLIIH